MYATHPLSLDIWGQSFLRQYLCPGMRVVDATCGNGHDTLFLAEAVGQKGQVWAFDVQVEALQTTQERVDVAKKAENSLAPITYIQAGHEDMTKFVPPPVDAVLFNLGYLPRSDKTCSTSAHTTLAALTAAQELLRVGGYIWVHSYTGHPGGQEEYAAILQYAAALAYEEWRVLHTSTLNKALRPEHIFLLQKRRD